MSVLTRYINRVFFIRLLVVLFAVTGFAAVLDLLEVADTFAEAPGGAAAPALRYFGLRLPMIASELLAIAALLAGILAVGELLRHRELVVVWSAGVSTLRILVLLLPSVLALFVFKLVVDDVLVPRNAAILRTWAIGDFKASPVTGAPGDWYWLRAGADIFRVAAGPAAAGRLRDLTIFRRDANAVLVERLHAAAAEPSPGGLTLRDVTRWDLATRSVERRPELGWSGALDVERIKLLATPPRELPAGRLVELLAAGVYGMRAAEPYATALHARGAGAVLPGLLLLLAFALGRRFSRTASVAPILIQGVAIGFTAIIVAGVLSALGEVGVLTPAAAAWLPLLALLLAVVLLGGARFRARAT